MKLLITGSNGLLGQKLVKLCLQEQIQFVASSKGVNRNPDCPQSYYVELDITDKKLVGNLISEIRPSHIIHTAAMTNVDACESAPQDCELLNVTATHYLFDAAKSVNAHFQLLSTDFIFDGTKGEYKEDDEPNPLSVYAKSKFEAERLLLQDDYTNWSIVRTIIVYGFGNNLSRSNIIVWAKGALEKGEPLNIVNDQFRAPTYADDLASGCISVLLNEKVGVFHISGPETLSIFDIVIRIGRHFNLDTSIVRQISSDTLNQAARRPPRTGFDLSKSYRELQYKPHTLEESLDEMYL